MTGVAKKTECATFTKGYTRPVLLQLPDSSLATGYRLCGVPGVAFPSHSHRLVRRLYPYSR